MEADDLAVARHVQVGLEARRPELRRQPEGGEGVLGRAAGGAAVGDGERRAAVGRTGHVGAGREGLGGRWGKEEGAGEECGGGEHRQLA